MTASYFPLDGDVPFGSIVTRASTGYADANATGDLAVFGVNQARFEYNATLGGYAYKSEPAYTNLFTAPTDFTDGAWTHQQNPGDVSVNADVGNAPDGTATADRLNFLAAAADIGLSQVAGGLIDGTQFMTSIFVQEDTNPDDFQIKNPAGAGNIVNGIATANWQRAVRLDTVVLGFSGLYLRRNAGLNGALRLWGAMRHAMSGQKVFAYHPSAFAGDRLQIPVGNLDGDQGLLALDWVPKFNAVDEVGLAETVLGVWSPSGLKLAWAGEDTPAYLRLYNDDQVIATLATRHAVDDLLRVRVHWGGTPNTPGYSKHPHLEVNGWMMRASREWASFVPPMLAYLGCDATGNQCAGLYRYLTVDSQRIIPAARLASLGDSISYEPYGSGTRSWNRRAGELLQPAGRQILVAGVLNDRWLSLQARLQNDVVDQGVTHCVVLCGVNDLVGNRTLAQMQADALAVFDALWSARIQVIACTILPFGLAASWNAAREAIRVAFNDWLKAGLQKVDLVVDTATALADPFNSEVLLAAYDSGDGVHPSDAGSDELADTVIEAIFGSSGIANPGFEEPGPTAPGEANSWTFTRTATVEEFAGFDETTSPSEDFDSAWGPFDPAVAGDAAWFPIDAFDDEAHLDAASFSGPLREDFEFGWDNDPGVWTDLDALTTDAADFDAGTVAFEDMENAWNLPHAITAAQNEDGLGGLAPQFESTSTAASWTIQTGVNDQFRIDFTSDGSLTILCTIAAGTYTLAQLRNAVDAALDAQIGSVGGIIGELATQETSTDRLQIRIFEGGALQRFRLRGVATRSAWSILGFTPWPLFEQLIHFRAKESVSLDAADFDAGAEAYEDFNEQWRNNENSDWTWSMVTEEAALFDVGVQAVEDFENGWTLAMVP